MCFFGSYPGDRALRPKLRPEQCVELLILAITHVTDHYNKGSGVTLPGLDMETNQGPPLELE